ncbi:metallophosphoesterase family protein, partial [Streptomyces sp. NPDC054961]
MIVIAHLSDVHLDGGDRAAGRTRAVMEYLEGLPYALDAVLVSGDITDHGTGAQYEEARKALVSRHPLIVCPGNHDEGGRGGGAGGGGGPGPGGPAPNTERDSWRRGSAGGEDSRL